MLLDQVKVWVGENLAHYYVLSRFLISRMLTVTKVPQMKVRTCLLEHPAHHASHMPNAT